MMNKKNKKWIPRSWSFYLMAAFIIFSVVYWLIFNLPRSFLEYKFHSDIARYLKDRPEEINLVDFMDSDWELVCESHGYDEELYLKKYNKKFPTAGEMQDGAWGLIFIYKDGGYNLVSSSCKGGIYFTFLSNRCLSRENAKLFFKKYERDCSYFSAK